MLLVEIDMLSQRGSQFNQKVNNVGINCTTDLVDEVRDVTYIWVFSGKHRSAIRYKSKVTLREMQQGDLVLRKVVFPTDKGKLQPN